MSELDDALGTEPREGSTIWIERLTGVVAILGGVLTLCVAVLVCTSVLGRWLFGTPVEGDFEFVKMATAIAIFAYLPYTQARRANIIVDTFTNWLPVRARQFIDAFWDLVLVAIMGLLAVGLVVGTMDAIRSGETTQQLQIAVWPAIAVCAVLAALLVRHDNSHCCAVDRRSVMSGVTLALLGFGAMLVLIVLRAPIALSMLVVGAVGYMHLNGWNAFFNYMKTNSYHQFANYTLSVIPLFILMGALAERAGIAQSLFKSAEGALGRFRGGLAMAVIGACTAFGAICGSSVATTATFGRAALPELTKYKYNGGLATGTIAVGGTLGILIPPSVILVVYAITTEQNIAKLFQAALIPGLMAALFYCLTIAIVVRRNPELAPMPDKGVEVEKTKQPWWPKIVAVALLAGIAAQVYRGAMDWDVAIVNVALAALIAFVDVAVMPAILIAVVVVGGIYGGVFTPTEGAAVGAIAMMVVGLVPGQA